MMTRKDYEAIAACIVASRREVNDDNREEAHNDAYYALDVVADRLANILALDNPRFDRTRFLKACGAL